MYKYIWMCSIYIFFINIDLHPLCRQRKDKYSDQNNYFFCFFETTDLPFLWSLQTNVLFNKKKYMYVEHVYISMPLIWNIYKLGRIILHLKKIPCSSNPEPKWFSLSIHTVLPAFNIQTCP
jgi:hypothetical protein